MLYSVYCYYSKYLKPEPSKSLGFKEAQCTFEFWRIKKFRIRAQVGYNSYNSTYSTVNLDAVAAMQVWTASDLSTNETVSGESLLSYNNAKVHTLSLNAIKTLVNTQCRINDQTAQPIPILPGSTWLDTSTDISNNSVYSGAQIFMKMPGITSTNWLPEVQLIFEVDVEFKQPAYQNRPTFFESTFIGSTLSVIHDASDPEDFRDYTVVAYTIDGTDDNVRLERVDGVAGSLDYTKLEFWEVFVNNTSGKYFSDRPCHYTGPTPRKPLGWTPSV